MDGRLRGRRRGARAGVVIFKAVSPTPAGQMESKLVGMAKEQSRDVYEVETLGGDLTPRMLYRVHPDGSKKLVRGAVFDELDNRSLRSDVLAVGDDAYVAQTLGADSGDDDCAEFAVWGYRGEAGERGAAEAAVLCGAEVRMSEEEMLAAPVVGEGGGDGSGGGS